MIAYWLGWLLIAHALFVFLLGSIFHAKSPWDAGGATIVGTSLIAGAILLVGAH